ncbi:ParB N-terminal domain-containing protein [Azospirillum soli]|uniref:ParB N-terminal domain-containing protein n=1 Tax=Azospirillum soli TaxID=1304799 RepID=UPI001AE1A4E0|nr:ParB N-terminal domain-containing protein [Azospirillum soli]MBP2316884.1 hypothetical protein [Azospirillum soli]
MKTIAIPLGRLRLADTNMRISRRTAGLEELKASLLVHGQLQPIVVTRPPEGGFAVVAGARLTLAARALVAEGKWPDTARLAAVRRRADPAALPPATCARCCAGRGYQPATRCPACWRLTRRPAAR